MTGCSFKFSPLNLFILFFNQITVSLKTTTVVLSITIKYKLFLSNGKFQSNNGTFSKKKKKNQITASILLRWDDMVQRATHAFCVSEFLDNNKEL